VKNATAARNCQPAHAPDTLPLVEETGSEIEKQIRPAPGEHAAESDYALPRRLVVCLDGTWNKRESGTNVYHLANLVQEGKVDDDTRQQLVYYDEGVGTGVLDNVTGGAFGIGLSANVREAYDWLVEKYRDGERHGHADEIYIFGFSRGAFTARSLTGLISRCGLLHRGAPMPPEQLWVGYRQLGTAHEAQGERPPFRRLRELKQAPWATTAPALRPLVPLKDLNATERLLFRWSRRVPVHCLAVFDTVGALGVDALAIPWLQERRAAFHDTQLSEIVVNAFQALAIDEHRASFAHIPWTRPTSDPSPPDQTAQGGQIEQRWFAGAHANIGGGDDDNPLAQLPLMWFVGRCQALGLVFKPRRPLDPHIGRRVPALRHSVPLATPLPPRSRPRVSDSYSEFLRGAWRHLARAKRDYRRLVSTPYLENGQEVRPLNDRVDESVYELIALEQRLHGTRSYNPPNVWEFLTRTGRPVPAAPKLRYLQSATWTLLPWLLFVAAGGAMVGHVFTGSSTWAWRLAIAFAVAAGVNDWAESWLNHRGALAHPGSAGELRKHRLLRAMLVVRLLALLAIALGVGYVAFALLAWGVLHLPRLR
jgi:uncharacterized protein (DUF2235 family)